DGAGAGGARADGSGAGVAGAGVVGAGVAGSGGVGADGAGSGVARAGAAGAIREPGVAYQWYTGTSFRLPEKVAYGASVTTPGGIVCIGGETATGYSKKVFLLRWDPARRKLRFKDLPDLPVALANAGAALIGQTVYVVGGENAERALTGLFSLDLAQPAGWQRLPDVPLAISHSAVVAQSGMIYVIGGRSKTASGVSTLHNTVFRYDPSAMIWQQLRPVGDGIHPPHLAAANAVADDKGGILVIGGDDGRVFHELETLNARIAAASGDVLRRRLLSRKLAIIGSHPGFWRGILRYDPSGDRWTGLGDLPVPAPVTTTAVRWNDAVVIPCGEIKPGTRSADILMGRLNP
ncbi:MAG TPA: kelch repeat-containing protein, partial [Puia sp.]|nr:kelch repeat-containing protein [Puia sp.]